MNNQPLAFLIAFAVTIILTPLSIIAAKKVGAIDYPGGRRINKKPVTRLGGIAIYGGFWAAVLGTQGISRDIMGLLLGSLVIFLAGLWDDIRGLRPLYKFLWQIAAVVVLLLFGFNMESFSLPLIGQIQLDKHGLGFLSVVLTLFWMVGMINTVNILDGLDGLAAGICLIVALLLFWSARQISDYPQALSAAHWTLALAGAALGFLFFNFYPSRLFMGDSGSMFLGFVIGGVSIYGLLKTATILGLVFPLLILALPLSDITFSIIRRKLRGKPIAEADGGHLHHRLLDVGLTQRQAALLLYLISGGFGLAAVLLAKGHWVWALLLLVFDFSLLLSILFRRKYLSAIFRKKLNKSGG
ncbi:MAG: undecaprenyl/decaprenyl-phosphate alpha-N-acetylglucosaminyl 1-phosphate transferase [Peptococcaceae bacterium]|jgi:UDP-GlcNAc:undecaprenyl-phosphate GlcNAc-1-phosphate transferase|nr:undecaprenyl/decaprenyl-phosphate alpha-N-acetylglucosaminyl 1-phosphate transferase [Peptococcaceae bacterium]